jgi:tripartite-type tricarboxylate transporter receptor subunit TctC
VNTNRRTLLSLGAGALLAFSVTLSSAQSEWPTRPVRVISPYGAGGSNDISARILAEELGRRLGQQFNVENKAGAGTRLANDAVAKATGDGYTLLYAAAPYATAAAMVDKLAYDPEKDLLPVTLAVAAPIFLIVNADSPFKTMQDLIAYGKSKPVGLTVASPGAGSGPHLAAELLFREAGVKGLNVHFRGDATAYTELLAGRVDATLTAISTALPHIKSGKLRVLGVASEQRSPVYPDARTLAEQGMPTVVAYGWFGFIAPIATPRPIVQKLQTEVNQILADPAVKQRLLALGLEPRGGTPTAFAAFIDAESRKWSDVIRKANIKGD